jgi:hypothetical protein
MKSFFWAAALGGALMVAVPAFADVDDCYSAPGNLVANCGFEDGTYSSTIGTNTNNGVPVDWTPNAGFDLEPSFNDVRNGPVYQGNYALSIGNYDYEPAPALSQTLTDQNGAVYQGSLWIAYGGAGTSDQLPFFNVSINGTPVVSLNNTAAGTYTEYTFSFAGTGSDTLTLTGNTSPSEWFVDNVTVAGSGASVTPEPALFLPIGFLGAAILVARRRVGSRAPSRQL